MAGEITRPWPGGRPGPWRTFSDKTPDTPEIDRGSTRITKLRPGKVGPYFDVIADKAGSFVGATRDGTQITKLRPKGVSPVYAIADKTPSLTDSKFAADTWRPILTLGSVSEITILITDTWRPILTLAASVNAVVTAADTWRPVLSLGQSVIKGEPTTISRSDTWTPVLTLAANVLDLIPAADTWVPVLTLAVGNLDQSSVVTASDTWTPVLRLTGNLTPHTSATKSVVDTWSVRLTLAGVRGEVAPDVDQIIGTLRPYGQIVGRWI